VAFPSEGFRDKTVRGRESLSGGGFVAAGLAGFAWVEASLPKRVRGEDVEGLDVPEVARAVEATIDAACEVVIPSRSVVTGADGMGDVGVSVEDPRVVRLDLVRDFQLHGPDVLTPLLSGLAEVPRASRIKVRRFNDCRSGRAETLRVGPGAWDATLHDECAETGGLVPRGYLRSEFRPRGRQLVSRPVRNPAGAIVRVSDLSVDRAEGVRRMWFDRVGFGSSVGGSPDRWANLRALGLSDREMLYFVGWLEARRAGVAVRVSEPTDLGCRRILRSLQPGDGGRRRVGLDYDMGHELVEEHAAEQCHRHRLPWTRVAFGQSVGQGIGTTRSSLSALGRGCSKPCRTRTSGR